MFICDQTINTSLSDEKRIELALKNIQTAFPSATSTVYMQGKIDNLKNIPQNFRAYKLLMKYVNALSKLKGKM